MTRKQVTDEIRRFHYSVDPEARVIDCFRVEVMEIHLHTSSHNRPNVQLKQLWAEALDTAKFLRNTFNQRDWRQYGLKGPNDFRTFAYIIGCQEEREQVKHGINLDLLCYQSNANSSDHPYYRADPNDHMRRVRHLQDAWDGLEWLEQN
jgi:hypothetical protein